MEVEKGVNTIEYTWEVSDDDKFSLRSGVYTMELYEGGTYRSLDSEKTYTITEIDPQPRTIRYGYSRDGELIERNGWPTDLAVVEAIDDSPGGIIDGPTDEV